MRVTVLFFGATADIAGQRKMEIEIDAETASREAFRRIIDRHPRLSTHRLLYSVNEEYASGSEILSEGDRLGIFTAVSGG